MEHSSLFILSVITIAYLFDFINGFHDAANSIATIVTTGVLTPRQAVLWAAFFNFIAFLFFSLMVAKTIGNGLISPTIITPQLILAALLAAIFWNLLTWYFGLPSSSSHAIIGGLAGAALIQGGLSTLQAGGFIKVAIGIFIAPTLGIGGGILLAWISARCLRRHDETKVNRLFKGFQLASSALLSITHGSNDAQKTMGIIAVLLLSGGWIHGDFHIPFWVVISCQAMISLGTLMGGWRIVRTMGNKITQLNTMRGCAAETAAAAIIFAATEYGVPVSTTQTVTGSIAGVGLINGVRGTQWPMFRLIFLSWLFTIPATAVVASLMMWMLNLLFIVIA